MRVRRAEEGLRIADAHISGRDSGRAYFRFRLELLSCRPLTDVLLQVGQVDKVGLCVVVERVNLQHNASECESDGYTKQRIARVPGIFARAWHTCYGASAGWKCLPRLRSAHFFEEK